MNPFADWSDAPNPFFASTSVSSPLKRKSAADINPNSQVDNQASRDDHSPPSSLDPNHDQDADRVKRRKEKRVAKQKKRLLEVRHHVSTLRFIWLEFAILSCQPGKLFPEKDWQNAVLWLLADGINPSWILFKNKETIQRVVCIMVPQLDPSLFLPGFQSHRLPNELLPPKSDQLPVLASYFNEVFITEGPGEKHRLVSPLAGFLQVPLTTMQKAKMKSLLEGQKIKTVCGYLLDDRQWEEHEFPDWKKDKLKKSGWCRVKMSVEESTVKEDDGFTVVSRKKKIEQQHVLALDCEMCFTEDGLECTRVTIVNDRLETVYDKMVKPEKAIIDYNTKFSGITAEMMQNVETTLTEVHKDLLELIHVDTILIGHSLENDLRALKFYHHRVIDTSIIFHSSRGPPSKPSLKYLAQRHLRKIIQDSDDGHDSAEDARICMELLHLKMQRGPSYGLVVNESESLFSRLKRNGRSSLIIDTRTTVTNFSTDAISSIVTMTDDESVRVSVEKMKEFDFSWVRLRDYELALDPRPPSESPTSSPEATTNGTTVKSPEEALASVNKNLTTLLEAMPPRTCVMVLSGQGQTKAASKLLSMKSEYMNLCQRHAIHIVHQQYSDKVFGEDKIALLEEEIKKARAGVGFLGFIQERQD